MTETATIQLRLRFFASSRAAMGRSELSLELERGSTIAGALDAVLGDARVILPAVGGSAGLAQNATAVLARCSFLVNGIATTDRAHTLAEGDLIDVLPPFAGG